MTRISPYRTFWRRFWAGLVDGVLLTLSAGALGIWVDRCWASPVAKAVCLTALSAVPPAYSILMHGRYGQTIGKRLLRVRVVQLSGLPLSMWQAVLREAINVPFLLWTTVAVVLDVLHGGSPTRPSHPEYGPPVLLTNCLLGAELLSTLFSRKRRAIHDFIAGSVVVRVDASRKKTFARRLTESASSTAT